MLNMADVELYLVTAMDMYLMIEKGIRGGMTQVSLKHVVANNKYMKTYDKNKPSIYLSYLDANNLYGLAMSKYLPYADFKWCEITKNEILNYDEKSDTGYFLEVDLEYPKELHDKHNDYPLAPELMTVKADMLSSTSKYIYI
jgi:RNA-splicing ligase RtcB